MEEVEEKRHRKIRSILFWGATVVVFGILALFLASFLGMPIGKSIQEWANNIPVIKAVVPDQKSEQASSDNQTEGKVASLTADLKEKEQQIKLLEQELSDTQKSVEQLKKSNLELEQQLETDQQDAADKQTKQLADIYKNMPAKKAAAMISSMSLEDAAMTISQLKTDQQSSILGSMEDTKKAAQISLLVKEIAGISQSDITAMKENIHEMALEQENPTQVMANTIGDMPPAQAAGIIQSMMSSNSQAAMDLLKSMNNDSRAQVLTEIQKNDANMAARIATGLNS